MARIGLISALRYELPNMIPYGHFKQVRSYKMKNNDIGVLVSGVGYKRAERATERLCKEFNPDVLIMLGFCGCTDSMISVGTLIVANAVHYNGKQESLENLELKNLKRFLSDSSIDYKIGMFQTFDHPVLSNGPVLDGVIAVDMEAFAIVRKAYELDVTPIIIKSVSDILPKKEPILFPTIRLQFRMYRNFMSAKKGLNDFSNIWFR